MAKHTFQDNFTNRRNPQNRLSKRLTYKLLLALTSFAIILTACSQPAAPTISPTSTATEALGPTETATKTSTPTNTPEPTLTPTLEPLVLGNFSAHLEGIGTHGTMACYSYDGDAADLEGLTLIAYIERGGKWIEEKILSQEIEGRKCFELVDAKYVSIDPDDGMLIIPEDSISLQITAKSENEIEIINETQTINLGQFVQFPFLEWIYDVLEMCKGNGFVWDTDTNRLHNAWDFIPKPTEENPTIIGTPIYSPVEGVMYNVRTSDGNNCAILIYSQSTGYLIKLIHSSNYVVTDGSLSLADELQNRDIEAGDLLGFIGPLEEGSDAPHTHFEIQAWPEGIADDITSRELYIKQYDKMYAQGNSIDFGKLELFLDDSVNLYLNSLPDFFDFCNPPWGTAYSILPEQELSFTIDGNADDWVEYKPVLTDSSGDSEGGDVMDMTELYTATDSNYLYLMLNAGSQPSGQWVLNLYLDAQEGGQCGDADKFIQISSEYPDAFAIETLNGCDYGDDAQRYLAIYDWNGDTFETKIPLAFLGETSNLNITQIYTYMQQSDESWIKPDTMP